MLEKIGRPEAATLSIPMQSVVDAISYIKANQHAPVFAEFGVGIGATTLEVAKILNNSGEIHVFDFHENVQELRNDLYTRGFTNVFPHGNTSKYWDSYHWNVSKLLQAGQDERFDLIYIDGAHTYLHDALAFFMCDRLLKVGGIMIFDDWNWRYADSQYMKDIRHLYMTDEQISANQIGMFIRELVETHIGYETLLANEVYRKVASSTKSTVPHNRSGFATKV
jgi:predicted O-methyltransferase YrrM